MLTFYNRFLCTLIYGKFTSIRSLCHAELLSNLRAHLCCITINSLFATENNLKLTIHGSLNMTNSGCNRIACSQCIGTTKGTIRYEHRIISTQSQTLTQCVFCLWRAHSNNSNTTAFILVFHSQSRFKGMHIVRIYNAR